MIIRKRKGTKALTVIMAVIMAFTVWSTVPMLGLGSSEAVYADGDDIEIKWGWDFDDEDAGYLNFNYDAASNEIATTTIELPDDWEFDPTVNDITDLVETASTELPDGLTLSDFEFDDATSPTAVKLEFTYEPGKKLFDPESTGTRDDKSPTRIGELDLFFDADAVVDYAGADIEVPIVVEVTRSWEIAHGARQYRELFQSRSGFQGAYYDWTYDVEDSTNWVDYDFSQLGGSYGTFNILENYKTLQQPTDWACGVTSALTVLDYWGNLDGGTVSEGRKVSEQWNEDTSTFDALDTPVLLNEEDFARLRTGHDWGGPTHQKELERMFDNLSTKYNQPEWNYVSGLDIEPAPIGTPSVPAYEQEPQINVLGGDDPAYDKSLFDAVPWYIEHGVPVVIGWQGWGGHYESIIGYDDMGTADQADDVVLLMDPYETVDQNWNGYWVRSWKKIKDDWSVGSFGGDFRGPASERLSRFVFIAAWPEDFDPTTYQLDNKGAIPWTNDNDDTTVATVIEGTDSIDYQEKISDQLAELASAGDEPQSFFDDGTDIADLNHDDTKWWKTDMDETTYTNSRVLKLDGIDNYSDFETIQASARHLDGPASLLMSMNYFEPTGDLTDIDLAKLKGEDKELKRSSLKDMINIIDALNEESIEETGEPAWSYYSKFDQTAGKKFFGETVNTNTRLGTDIISLAMKNDVPLMSMKHEGGDQWFTIIGFEDPLDNDDANWTYDDTLVYADPADYTDHNMNGLSQYWYGWLKFDWGNSLGLSNTVSPSESYLAVWPYEAEPEIDWGWDYADEDEGYLLFDYDGEGDQKEVTTVALDLPGSWEFDTSITNVDNFVGEDTELPEGLDLEGVEFNGTQSAILEFEYESESELFEGEAWDRRNPRRIGTLDITIDSSAVSKYSGDDIDLPIVAEAAKKWEIPYGARVYRELFTNKHGGSNPNYFTGAKEDWTEDIEDSTYWMQPDFYEYGGKYGSLSILENYRTQQQPTGYSCGISSALSVLDYWDNQGYTGRYVEKIASGAGVYKNINPTMLNEQDLSKLRNANGPGGNRDWGSATKQSEIENVFKNLESYYNQEEWYFTSGNDLDPEPSDNTPANEIMPELNVLEPIGEEETMSLAEAVPWYINHGVPVILGWQGWGGHYETIIGYDDMGTPTQDDDVVILEDPYDSVDHKNDGYLIKPWQKIINDWSVGSWGENLKRFVFLAAWPSDYDIEDTSNLLTVTGSEIPWDYDDDPYWFSDPDSMATDNTDTTKLDIDKYSDFVSKQASAENLDGPASLLSVMNYYESTGTLTDMDLAQLKGTEKKLKKSTLKDMTGIIDKLNDKSIAETGQPAWGYYSTFDMNNGEEFFGEEVDEYNVIQTALENNVPLMSMAHEGGDQWNVIIGHEDVTGDDEDEMTQEDVLVMADPVDISDHEDNGLSIYQYEWLIYDWGNSITPNSESPSMSFLAIWPLEIKPEPAKINISAAKVDSIKNQTYNNKAKKPAVKVTLGTKVLKNGTDYTVTYSNNKKVGKANITIKGINQYAGTKNASFKINPKKTTTKKPKVGKKNIKVTWKKVKGTTKYQVRYKVKGAKKWKTKNVAAKKASLTIKKLKKGKKYQVQVRSYKTVNKVKYYSVWSKVKTSKKVK